MEEEGIDLDQDVGGEHKFVLWIIQFAAWPYVDSLDSGYEKIQDIVARTNCRGNSFK